MRALFFIFILSFPAVSLAQNKSLRLYGYVVDKSSGEILIGANIQVASTNTGASTNRYGFYSIVLPYDSATLTITMIGYERFSFKASTENGGRVDFELTPATYQLEGVSITAEKESENGLSPGVTKISRRDIEQLPAIFGEADPLKFMQILPGVKQGSEGSSGLFIRGGTPDQNLILLDGAPVYNIYHLFGFMSVFNVDAIKHVQLYKSGIPARYDSRLSSVVDIAMKEGNLKEPKGAFSVSPIAGTIAYETPLKKNKSALLITGRRTWLDGLYQLFASEPMGLNFYDFSAKLHMAVNESNRAYASFYGSRDKFYKNYNEFGSESKFNFKWGNFTGLFRWTSRLGDNLFLSSSAHYSKYYFNQIDSYTSGNYRQSRKVNSYIKEVSFNTALDYYPSNRHEIKIGIRAANRQFKPETVLSIDEQDGFYNAPNEIKTTILYDIFFEDLYKPFSGVEIYGGVRNSFYRLQGKTLVHWQPRFSVSYEAAKNLTLKGDYHFIVQPLHLLTNTTVGQPIDLWVPATRKAPSEKSHQYAFGITKKWANSPFELRLDLYYRDMENIIEYEDGASYLYGVDEGWEDKIEIGVGDSKGIELSLMKKEGRINGFIAYTLSKTDRKFNNINNGKKFPFKYDRRHEGSALLSYDFSSNKKFSAFFTFHTGNAISLPVATIQGIPPPDWIHTQFTKGVEFMQRRDILPLRNNTRMPDYHRLDISYHAIKKRENGNVRTWSFSIYNLYNRLNPFLILEENGKLIQYALFPVIPSISYKLDF